uniref:Uncharacterized protein n=1 Tax=Romanomermis culicivorax TaxID=13658 RepID=A0A915HMI7_ROMCU
MTPKRPQLTAMCSKSLKEIPLQSFNNVSLSKNITSTEDDSLSLIFLKEQKYAYIVIIMLCSTNMLTLGIFAQVAGSTPRLKNDMHVFLHHMIGAQVMASSLFMALNIFHLVHSIARISESMSPKKCFLAIAGLTNLTVVVSGLFSALMSVDRVLAIITPIFYKNRWYFYGYVKIILYLRVKCRNQTDQNSNLWEIRFKINNKITKALLFNTIWNLASVTVSSMATFFIWNLPYRGALIGIYFGSLYYTDGIALLISYTVFVADFRQCLVIMLKRKKANILVTNVSTRVKNEGRGGNKNKKPALITDWLMPDAPKVENIDRGKIVNGKGGLTCYSDITT